MSFIQYVGQTEHHKVFVNVGNRFFKNSEGAFTCMIKNECVIEPIDPNMFDDLVNRHPISGRYEVRQYGEVFIADENHRDSYPFHLSGFKKIKEMVVGEIIPFNGFTTPEFLSLTDKKLINKETTVARIVSGIDKG